tara:strand:+ start:550 stop:1071 length:522 start_codon:yes stop_codon:yes gene_type:complete
MKIVDKNVSDLIPADYNPREVTKKQYSEIKESIDKFGLVDPLIVNIHPDRKNILVGGHQRLQVIKDIGSKTAPCVEVNLDEKQEQELNIRLNKNQGQWNFDSLANFFDTDSLIDWGFDYKELSFTLEPLDLDTEELSLDKKFEVIIEVNDVETQENLYNELTDRGLKCRILSL